MIRILPLFFVWIAALALAQAPGLWTQPQIDGLVTDLDNGKFAVRQKAHTALDKALITQFAMTEASLKAAAQNPLSLEQQQRAKSLLAKTVATESGLLQGLLQEFVNHPSNRATLDVANRIFDRLERGDTPRDAVTAAGFEVEVRFPPVEARNQPLIHIIRRNGVFYKVEFYKHGPIVTPVMRGPRGTWPTVEIAIRLDQYLTPHQLAARGFPPGAALPVIQLQVAGVQVMQYYEKLPGGRVIVHRVHLLNVPMENQGFVSDFFTQRLGFARAAVHQAILDLKQIVGYTFYGSIPYNPR